MYHLVVVRAFGAYSVGEIISDRSLVDAILSSEHAEHVVRITPKSEG